MLAAYLQVLLGYLPPSPEDWSQVLAKQRTQYHVFCSVSGVQGCAPVHCKYKSHHLGMVSRCSIPHDRALAG
jgi:hypothetical protein